MMTKQEPSYHSLLVPKGQSLIAVPRRIGGLDFIECFPTEDDRQAAEQDEVRNKALEAAGAWGDADADAFFEELERARNDAAPAPYVSLLDPDRPNEVSIESRGQSRS
jgi:hypothetical protein